MIVVAIDLTVLPDGAIEEWLPGILLDLVEFEKGSIEGDTLFGFWSEVIFGVIDILVIF